MTAAYPDSFTIADDTSPEAGRVRQLGREPPVAIESERVLVATALDDWEAFRDAVPDLRPAEFFHEGLRRIYEAAISLSLRGDPISVSTIGAELRRTDRLRQVGIELLGEIAFAPSAAGANLRYHLERVRSAAATRALIRAAESVAARGYTSQDFDELAALARTTLDDALTPRRRLLEPVSVEELLAPLSDVPWLVPDLGICPGAPVLLAGYGYAGKTIAAQSFAVAVASGTRAFARFFCRQGRVVHLDYEQGKRLTVERYQRLARAAGVYLAEIADSLDVIVHPSLYLDSAAPEDALVRACTGAVLCIVDSLRACAPSLDENSSDMRRPLDMLARVSERTGCVFLVLHHARKPSKQDPPGARYAIRGSAALFDACGSVFVLAGEKGEPARMSHEKDRARGRPAEDFCLVVSDVTINGIERAGLAMTYQTAQQAGGRESSPKAELEALYARTLAAVEANPGVAGKAVLARLMRTREADIKVAIDELTVRGLVANRGSIGRPRLFTINDGSHE